ncbi:MBL fold metallo-hydrolase [Salipaludibacillus sp. CF4.18]|uniref:MBL fold metallo-hydrolase n=1 Tax=Salipaludibacillus sp. CF4.18 TaxID=3373081 RepID=UPI003EE62948
MIEVTSHSNVTCVKGHVKLKGVPMAVNMFLIDSMLIDTGPVSLLHEYIPFFKRNEIDFVALTHYHEDHTGCAPWIQQNLKCPIYINHHSINECLNVSEYPRFRKEFWGQREGFIALPIKDIIRSRNNSWKVISTPGHSKDHIVLLNTTTGVLFSGDLFITSKLKGALPEESIYAMILSLRKVLTYDFKGIFCSHAGYIQDGKLVIQKKLDYLENVRSDILDLNGNGLSASEINQRLFPQPPALIAISGYKWDSMYIINNVLKEIRE